MSAGPIDANAARTDELPRFVVVGNVNQGKSSVVAALTEDESVPIDDFPGTTKRSGEYVLQVAGRPLFRIVDTPGFQQPRQALAYLQSRAAALSAAERPAAVRRFVEERRAEFADEVELLRPILDGAGILYVVDASAPLQPANEAEMEILRWTGQPAMALLNRVRTRDRSEQWRPVLRQFFHIVREFDAHRARFPDRVALLKGFREIRPEWSGAIDATVAAMEREWQERGRRAVTAIGDLLLEALGHVERRPLPEGADEPKLRTELEAAYRDAQRKLEKSSRDRVEGIYRHPGLDRDDDPEVDLLGEDLFSETTWKLFGLSRAQLVRYGLVGGAATGVAGDLAFGGASLGAWAAVGALVGGAVGWLAGTQIASFWTGANPLAKVLFPADTGRFLALGPVTSQRYAWVLLDRALVHFRAVRDRSHARRDALAAIGAGEEGRGIAAALPREQRDPLDRALRRVLADLKNRGAAEPESRRELEFVLNSLIAKLPPRE